MIAWHVHNSGAPGARAVVWLHGFMGSGADFDGVTGALRHWRHVAPDLPGHGGTRATRFSDHAMPAMADALVAWLDAQNVERPHLVGYSMGGRLALHLACRFRDRFGAVVAVSATPGLADPAEAAARRQADRALARRLMTAPLPDFLDAWNAQPLFAGLDSTDPAVAAQHARRLKQAPAELARSLRAMGTGSMAPLWDALPRLPAPVDAVVGERDTKFAAIAGQMAAAGPVRVHTIQGAGHAPHLERPATFAETLYLVFERDLNCQDN